LQVTYQTERDTRLDARYLVALTVVLLAAYLLVYGGRFHIIDEVSIYSMGENLAKRGTLDTNQILWTQWVRDPKEVQGAFAADGSVYSKKGLATAFLPALLVRLGMLNPGWGLVSISLFTNAIVTALTAALLAAYAARLGARRRTALILGAVYGLATIALPYTRTLFGEPSSALALVAAAFCLTYVDGNRRTGWALLAGLCLSFAVWTRLMTLLAFLPFAIYLLQKRVGIKPLAVFALATALVGLGGYLWYDFYRFGNALISGYQFAQGESFNSPLLTGLYGLLLSPFRGLFWFTPVLLAAIPGAVLSWRRMRAEAILAVGLILVYLLLYSAWWMWWGGFAWGPRFLVPIVPFALVLTIPLWEAPRAFWAMLVLAVVSFVVQLLAVTADFTLAETILEEAFGNPAHSAAMTSPQWSPIVLQARLLAQGFWDIAWHRIGRAALPAVAAAVASAALALFILLGRGRPALRRLALCGSVILIVVAYISGLEVISRYSRETPPEASIAQALAPVNGEYQANETLITLAPYDYSAVMNWLHARVPVLGLAAHSAPLKQQEEQLLEAALQNSSRLRLLAPRLMPADEQVYAERWLTEHAFISGQQSYGDTRLISYAVPRSGARTVPVTQGFAGDLALTQVVLDDQDLRPGGALLIETHWRADAPQTVDYTLFAHLLGPDGKVVAGFDAPPANGYARTSTWPVGATVIDRRALVVPASAAPGSYTLELGLYEPATGKRLALLDGGQSDAVRISGVGVR
jgi:hypothetical protein